MIPLEKQVTSLELSKRLKELGIKQDSLWHWVYLETEFCQDWILVQEDGSLTAVYENKNYSAFTVAELGEMLPEGYYSQKERNSWGCADADNHLAVTNVYDCDKIYTEADARAKMLIYLIENKHRVANE
jgi:hypothetical protein